jgi:hypothetical protein
MARPRAAIGEGLATLHAVDPLADRLLRDAALTSDAAGRLGQLHDVTHNFCSTARRQPGILVDVHPGLLLIDLACLATTSFNERPRMDNPPADDLVRLHS